MKKFAIEIKWAFIFVLVQLAWMYFEKLMGWHDENIARHAVYTNFFAIPAIIVYVLGLRDKRENYFDGQMTWMQGFVSGVVISLVVAVLTPVSQYIISTWITPDYFDNIIAYSVEQGELTIEEAQKHFNMSSYILQGVFGAMVMGVVTSAVVALFLKKGKRGEETSTAG